MKNPEYSNYGSLALVVILFASLIISCGDSSAEPITEQELVGQWAATEIEGAIDASGNPLPISGSVSTWTFNVDGTYRWFLNALPFFDFDGAGTYSLNGNTLTVTGIIANTLFLKRQVTKTPSRLHSAATPLAFGMRMTPGGPMLKYSENRFGFSR